jgi:uncharacterized protein (DUF433 family)
MITQPLSPAAPHPGRGSKRRNANHAPGGNVANNMQNGNGLLARITIDPEVCHGKPVIRGLRYPAETILELLSSGMTNREILSDYPDLESDDIRAVLMYAAALSRVKSIERVNA